MSEIGKKLTALQAKPSQWQKDKETDCGCKKRITLKHISSSATMNALVVNKTYYGFNESTGKVYDINATSVKASVTGTDIVDETASVATNGGICYTLDGTNDTLITGLQNMNPTPGAVEVTLSWGQGENDFNLTLEMPSSIKDVESCKMQHAYVASAYEIYPGRYPVKVTHANNSDVNDTIYLSISAPGEHKMFKLDTDTYGFDPGHVANIKNIKNNTDIWFIS